MFRLLGLVIIIGILQACSHPLEIVGEGDIVDLNESVHGCTLEQFQAADEACTKNIVIEGYDVEYQAVARQGWQFVTWDGTCKDKGLSNCAITLPASVVKDYWFKVMPATVAIFCEIGSICYSQDFEGLNAESSTALGLIGGEGFQVYNTTFSGTTVLYTYGPFTAPNGGPGFSAIATGEGGPSQGLQYLNIYSDYNNLDHQDANKRHETSVFKEYTIGAEDLGTYILSFDAKAPFTGGIDKTQVSAFAFIKTLDPNASFSTTNIIKIDMTNVKNKNWKHFSVKLDVTDELLEGQILQFGWTTIGGNYADSGVYYDNVGFGKAN